jgi:large subunit ribosomal protein L4
MKISVYNPQAEVIGEIELNAKIFEVKPSIHLLAEAVRIQAANARKGLAHTKTRGEVSGGGKKPWKQKGTGRARAGSTRGPIWRHGGVALGPRSDRNWSLKINKKAKTKALFMSLSDKANAGKIVIIDGLNMDKPKTKEFLQVWTALNQKAQSLGKKQLFVLPKANDSLVKSSRNLPTVSPVMASSLNVTDVLNTDTLVLMKDSLPVIEKTYLTKMTSVAS